MVLLGALEHGIYVDNKDDDECLGMSTARICQYFGIEQESDNDEDAVSTEEEGTHPSDIGDEDSIIDDTGADFGHEDSTFDDAEDWLAYLSEGEDKLIHEFSEEEQEQEIVSVYCHFINISFIKKFP